MTDHERIHSLERQVNLLRRLTVLCGAAVVFIATVGLTGHRNTTRFDVIEAERLNIVESDGRLALVIANAARLPGPIVRGREYPVDMAEGRGRSSGILFFNHEGTEAGGLVYGSEATEYGPQGSGSFTFDRMNQDQTIQLTHWDGKQSFSGLNVWDRPDLHVGDLMDAIMARRERRIESAELRRIAALHSEGTAHRLRLGSANRTALLELKDTRGRTRIRLSVDSLDVPSLEILGRPVTCGFGCRIDDRNAVPITPLKRHNEALKLPSRQPAT